MTPALKVLSLIQPGVLVAGAVLIGVALAPKVGLTAPASESLAAGRSMLRDLKPQLLPGLLGGVAGGLSILLTAALFKPLLTTETIERISKFGTVLLFCTAVSS